MCIFFSEHSLSHNIPLLIPNYVVVDFPHLNLPPNIRPWDINHPTVS